MYIFQLKKIFIIFLISLVLIIGVGFLLYNKFKTPRSTKQQLINENEHFLSNKEKEKLNIDSERKVRSKNVTSELFGSMPVLFFEDQKQQSLDTDQDGLSNEEEKKLGTNPNNRDTDGDGIDDPHEINLKTNPLNPDTNGDGISDGMEVKKMQSKQ